MKTVSLKLEETLLGDLQRVANTRGFTDFSSFMRQALRNELGRDEIHKIEERLGGTLSAIVTRLKRLEDQNDALYNLTQGKPMLSAPEEPIAPEQLALPTQLLTDDPNEARYLQNIRSITEARRNES